MKFPGNNGSRQSTANPLHHFLTSSDLVKIEGPYTLHYTQNWKDFSQKILEDIVA